MYVKVEPTGCCERKGLVQIRFSMYLEEGDYGYEKLHRLVPLILEGGLTGGYTGEVDSNGYPTDMDDYRSWLDNLPKVWSVSLFHSHFIYVEPELSDEVIMDIGEAVLNDAYIKWACDEKREVFNPPFKHPVTFDKAKVEAKVQHLKGATLERRL